MDFSFEKSGRLKISDAKSQRDANSNRKLNLVVVNTILPAVIFHDILEYGLSNYTSLPRIDSTSILSSCEVADIDFDRRKEILIGSSAENIMMYKKHRKKGWYLEEMKIIAAPILNLKYIDMTGDGVKDLVVLSIRGVHVLQHDLSILQDILDKKIQSLTVPSISEVIS
ncbi:hypothetical protein JTB14_008201 [Gonioctena quinquepunctata]|nr:hypothetical protein JTB14_008201 [Gonioctena quinquepunctata]